ncbi:sel1 repeat family protein [Kitasatospora sp. NPDC051853]|uniref:sel1 repeat family protein n=1 Tax=Kitasatospora sp. NPDC051853 TaxID=3364058 RepID=UPI003791F85D
MTDRSIASPAEPVAEGVRPASKQQHDEAVPPLERAARAGEPGAAGALAELLVSQGRFDQAVPWLERAAGEGDAGAARRRAVLAKDRGDWEEAERWYRSAAGRDGDCAFGLAELLRAGGDEAAALEWYDRGAGLGSLACLTNGAVLRLRRDGDRAAAEERLHRASAAGDHVADEALDAIGRAWGFAAAVEEALARPDDPKEVLDAFPGRDAFAAYPHLVDLAEPLYRRAAGLGVEGAVHAHASTLDAAGHFDRARQLLAAAHADGDVEAAYRLGLLHDHRARLDEAEHWYGLAAGQGHEDACWNLSQLLFRQRRLDEAAHWFGRFTTDDFAARLGAVEELRLAPDNLLDPADEQRLPGLRGRAEAGDPEAALELARLLDHRRDQPEAVRHYRRAFEGGRPEAGLALGRMLTRRTDTAPAHVLDLYRPAADAGDPEALEELARLQLRLEDMAGAERSLRRAAKLGVAKAAWWCGSKSDEYGDRQEAVRLWRIAGEAGEALPAFEAGRAMVADGDAAAAEPLLRLARESGQERRAAYWFARALLAQEGRLEEAVDALRVALTVFREAGGRGPGPFGRGPEDPRLELAEALLRLDRLDECGTLLTAVLDQYPGHRDAPAVAARLAARQGDQEALARHLETLARNGDANRPGLTEREITELLRQVTHQHP